MSFVRSASTSSIFRLVACPLCASIALLASLNFCSIYPPAAPPAPAEGTLAYAIQSFPNLDNTSVVDARARGEDGIFFRERSDPETISVAELEGAKFSVVYLRYPTLAIHDGLDPYNVLGYPNTLQQFDKLEDALNDLSAYVCDKIKEQRERENPEGTKEMQQFFTWG